MKKTLLTLLSIFLIGTIGQAQDKSSNQKQVKESLSVHINKDLKPDVYIDGKKYDSDIIDLLDPDKIASMNVVKGAKAIEQYNAPNGVVLITSNKEFVGLSPTIKIRNAEDEDAQPLIIINGKLSTQEVLSKLSPDDIESIEVVKDPTKIEEQYTAPNGLIKIKTRKN